MYLGHIPGSFCSSERWDLPVEKGGWQGGTEGGRIPTAGYDAAVETYCTLRSGISVS